MSLHSMMISLRARTVTSQLVRSIGGVVHDLKKTEECVKPFEEIPGPKSLPLVGTLWKYLPVTGEYKFHKLHHNGRKKLAEFGKVVREEIIPGVQIVWLFDPADIEKLFRSEGRYPNRRSHLALEKYRSDRPHVYKTAGIIPTNGPEWGKLRAIFQKGLSRPQNVRSYLPAADVVMREFLKRIDRLKQPTPDFSTELSRLFLELICLVAFDTRMSNLEEDEERDSRASKLIDAAFTANSCILQTDNGPQLWRRFFTPLYRKLSRSLQCLEEAAVEFVSQKMKLLASREETGGSLSLLEQYLLSPELDVKDVTTMAVDMLLAGVDTTTHTSGFTLYHLAVNPDKQQLLHEEACKILPADDSAITEDTIAKAPYTKACLKEAMRLNPISVGIGRILVQDAVFSGYSVPKGTVVVTQNQVSCRLPEYFKRPDGFIPERWIKGHELSEQPSPFLLLPFGHGPRSCIARRLAEQNMQVLLLRLLRDFEVGWVGGELDCDTVLINKPDQPLKFTFRKR